MEKMRKIATEVIEILRENKETRNSDDILYREYIRRYDDFFGLGVSVMPLGQFLTYRSMMQIPSIESIGRARRKIQAEYPELRGTNEQERRDAEKDYIAFSREKI